MGESLQPQYLTHSFLSLSLTPYLIKSTDATDRTACLIYSAYLNPDRPCLPYPPSHSDPSRKPSRSHRPHQSMPHATNGTMSQDQLTNGETPSSKFLSHVTSYPMVNDGIETFKQHPVGKKSLEIADGAYQRV